MTIKQKIIIAFMFSVIVPTLLVSGIGYFSSKNILQEEEIKGLTAVAQSRIRALEVNLDLRIEQASLLAEQDSLKRILLDIDKIDAGDVIYESDLQRRIDNFLNNTLGNWQTNTAFYDFTFLDSEGVVRMSNHEIIGVDYSSDERFVRGLSENYHTPSYFDESTDRPAMDTVVRITSLDDKNEPIGVVIATMGTGVINETLLAVDGLGDTGEVLLVQNISDNELVFVNQLRNDSDSPLMKKVSFGSKVALPAQDAVQGIDGQGLSVDYRGDDILAVWRYFPQWDSGLVAKIDKAEAFASIHRLRNILILAGIMIMLLMGSMAYFLARSISRPLSELVNVVDSISKGTFDVKVDEDVLKVKDEIGDLARAFERTMVSLKLAMKVRKGLGDIESSKYNEETKM